ncbi:MAG: DUF3006 domain-containing protein [Methanoregulaceae archaeon]|nr:DUF3006 domain-containing protein [Methanoregulaceae archaeon]
MVRATIDRIENGIAVLILHSGSHKPVAIPSIFLPDGCREGDIVTLTLERDPAGTQQERDVIGEQVERLKKR